MDAGADDADGEVRLAGARSADQDQVALLLEEGAAREVAHQRLVDGRLREVERVDLLGERHPGDRHLVLDGARLLLAELSRHEVADDALRLVPAFHGGGNDLVAHRRALVRIVEDGPITAIHGVVRWCKDLAQWIFEELPICRRDDGGARGAGAGHCRALGTAAALCAT